MYKFELPVVVVTQNTKHKKTFMCSENVFLCWTERHSKDSEDCIIYAAAAAEKIKTRAPLIEGGYDEQQV